MVRATVVGEAELCTVAPVIFTPPVPACSSNDEAPFVLPMVTAALPVPVALVAILTVCVLPLAVVALPMLIVLPAVD